MVGREGDALVRTESLGQSQLPFVLLPLFENDWWKLLYYGEMKEGRLVRAGYSKPVC